MKPEILIIDGHSASRQNLAARLGRKGFLVHQAEGIEEAYQAGDLSEVDIVLLDLVGFKEKALQHLTCVKNIFPEAEIILMTNLEQINLSILGMKMGAFDDLLTPVDVSALVSTIMAAWARKRQSSPPPRIEPWDRL